jgi:hypothetical protein
MSPTATAPMNLVQTPDYRESYANSVQVRVSVWDFQLVFGLASSESPEQVTIRNHQADLPEPAAGQGACGTCWGRIWPSTSRPSAR